jgi:hypothetical protein
MNDESRAKYGPPPPPPPPRYWRACRKLLGHWLSKAKIIPFIPSNKIRFMFILIRKTFKHDRGVKVDSNGTRGEREFRACWPLFLGVYWAFRSSSLAFSFLVFGSWALLVLVIASSGPGGFRLSRLLRVVAASCGCFKRYFVKRSVREVCAVGEDILLSEGNDRSKSKDNGRAFARREASASRVAKWHTRKSRF